MKKKSVILFFIIICRVQTSFAQFSPTSSGGILFGETDAATDRIGIGQFSLFSILPPQAAIDIINSISSKQQW